MAPPPSRRARGQRAEALAADHLQSLGFTVLTQNYRWRHGEIDLICREGDTLCFVEVRSRHSDRHGGAVETIDPRKQRRIARTAEHYLTYVLGTLRVACRFDVVTIDGIGGDEGGGAGGGPGEGGEGATVSAPVVTLLRDAFRIGG